MHQLASHQPLMNELIEILHNKECSLVVKAALGEITTYNKKGVRDLVWLLDNAPDRLPGAQIADKVIGKAAAGLIVCGEVHEVYADVMSRLALPLLDEANIAYSYGELVDKIVIPQGDNRCPLEAIVAESKTAEDVEHALRLHFEEMRNNLTNK